MNCLSRFAVIATALLLAACATQDPNQRLPLVTTGRVEAPTDKGIVVMGISVRNPRGDVLLGIGLPAWFGWMQFDPATGQRIGQHMVVAGEDCNAWGGGVAAGVPMRDSNACKTVQYRAFALEPGSYVLAWSYQGYTLYEFARFRSSNVSLKTNGVLNVLNSYRFSDDALVRAGNVSFSIASGEVAYVGDVTIDYENKDAKVSIGPGDPDAARKYVGTIGEMTNKLVDRPMARVTIDPAPPEQVSGGAK